MKTSQTNSWVQQPQAMPLRKALFKLHVWTGICTGLYLFFISITGSVLVYRNELLDLFIPDATGTFTEAQRLGMNAVYVLMEAHKNFFLDDIGRVLNGIGGLAMLTMVITGAVIWWPGVSSWRFSLKIRRGLNWRRTLWETHSTFGFWGFAFMFMFALSGVYLCFQDLFHMVADKIEPPTSENAGTRFVDSALYYLAFSHFGRLNGIALPCDGPGLCDQTFKAIWAFFGLVPAIMFGSGATLWFYRVRKASN